MSRFDEHTECPPHGETARLCHLPSDTFVDKQEICPKRLGEEDRCGLSWIEPEVQLERWIVDNPQPCCLVECVDAGLGPAPFHRLVPHRPRHDTKECWKDVRAPTRDK